MPAIAQIRQVDGQIIDLTTPAATFVDMVYAGTSPGSVAYPHLAGMTLMISRTRLDYSNYMGLANHWVDYSNGYPILNWGGASSATQYVVLAR